MSPRKEFDLGKGPKIKKRESMVFDHTPATVGFLFRIFSEFFLNFFSHCFGLFIIQNRF